MIKQDEEKTCPSSHHSLLKETTVNHSCCLVASFFMVSYCHRYSQLDMPSLTTVCVPKAFMFRYQLSFNGSIYRGE